jgi:hypothetical protein
VFILAVAVAAAVSPVLEMFALVVVGAVAVLG